MKTTAKTDNGPGARGVELQDPRRVGARGLQMNRFPIFLHQPSTLNYQPSTSPQPQMNTDEHRFGAKVKTPVPRRVGARGPQESRNHAIGAPNSDSARSETAETAMRCRPGGLTGRDRKIDDRNMPMNRASTLNHQ